ncbi:MAG: biotin transporter BioY, partial [Rhodobacteraceae bacterium]|nr:biotin transporter BioY [Paracoccaceae bacterium]
LVAGGVVALTLSSRVEVPMWPVPMTLQTLTVLLIGFAYGARLGGLTLLAFLAAGAAGLPVFAGGRPMFPPGPTFGFLAGFLMIAVLAGLAADRGLRGFVPTALVALALSALLYVPGVAWAMLADRLFGLDASAWGADSFAMIWQYYMAPFLVGDAVKAVIAALVVSAGWAAARARAG